MIFVCLGTQIYQFDRLTKKLDELVETGIIKEEIIAQIGAGEYLPHNYVYKKFMDIDEFKSCQERADLIISHAGTGALIGALKLGKQVIAVPRLAKYNEHVDDHQLQISGVLAKEGYLREVLDIDELADVIQECKDKPIIKKYDRPSNVLNLIINYIEKL